MGLINTYRIHLDLAMKNHSDEKCFVVLAILQVEKHWDKVKTCAIAYSPNVSALFRMRNQIPFTGNAVTTLTASLPN